MHVETVNWKNGRIKLIDQTKLPHKLVYIYCGDLKTLWKAIKTLQVRGAPAIGVAAAFGVALAARLSRAETFEGFERDIIRAISHLKSSRPTAVNLFWALERMKKTLYSSSRKAVKDIKKAMEKEAVRIFEEDRAMCRKMASFGAKFIKKRDSILTICNAGALATSDYGTALGVLYKAQEQGKKFRVYACETRPLLQGARLTMWELLQNGIDATLICDNMAATLMQQKKVNKIFVGADRIAANGDAANKIGTYGLAVLAKYHSIPFYVVAPSSSIDFSLKNGKDIPIEERHSDEVKCVHGRRVAPRLAKAYNPAFDVTPNELITAIITEKGVFKKPYGRTLKW